MVISDIEAAFTSHSLVAFVGQKFRQDKVTGLNVLLANKIHEKRLADVIILEADGARGRLLKGHKATEPVIPSRCNLVIAVVPIIVLGRTLNDSIGHRLERIESISGCRAGEPVTAQVIAKLLLQPDGYGHANPDTACFIPFINCVEDEKSQDAANRLVRVLLQAGIEKVVTGSARNKEVPAFLFSTNEVSNHV